MCIRDRLTADGTSGEIQKVAVGIDIRSGQALPDLQSVLEWMSINGICYEIDVYKRQEKENIFMDHFFVEESQIYDGTVHITGSDVNHIKNVLRMRPGEKILVSTGGEKEYHLSLIHI